MLLRPHFSLPLPTRISSYAGKRRKEENFSPRRRQSETVSPPVNWRNYQGGKKEEDEGENGDVGRRYEGKGRV